MGEYRNVYDAYAALLTYPRQDYHERIRRCCNGLSTAMKDSSNDSVAPKEQLQSAYSYLTSFRGRTENLSIEELEELYARTFDINPVASLEIGWQLYGESYERGSFLVRMRELLRACAIEESSELPDHLTHVLLALGRMESKSAEDFINAYVVKSLRKMLEGFEGKENPFENILLALLTLMTEGSTVVKE